MLENVILPIEIMQKPIIKPQRRFTNPKNHNFEKKMAKISIIFLVYVCSTEANSLKKVIKSSNRPSSTLVNIKSKLIKQKIEK